MLTIQIDDCTALSTLRNYLCIIEILIDNHPHQVSGLSLQKAIRNEENNVMNLPIGTPPATAAFAPGATLAPQQSSVPLPPVAASGPLVAGLDLDSKGMPWDGRIHAATRAKVADGTWRMKRGIDQAMVDLVRAEHAKAAAAPTHAPSPSLFAQTQGPAPAMAFASPQATTVAPPPPPPVAQQASTGTIQPSATFPGEPPRLTFPELMRKITAGYAAQQIDKASVDAALAALEMPSLPMLATRPDLLQPMADLLGIAS